MFTSKIPTQHWSGYIAPLLEAIIVDDGLQALRTAAVLVRRSDNGVGATWSRDDSPATIPPDPDILAYCYVKDAQEFDGTFSSLEAAFARGETSEPDRRIFVDFLARCVAMRLEDIVHGHYHPVA